MPRKVQWLRHENTSVLLTEYNQENAIPEWSTFGEVCCRQILETDPRRWYAWALTGLGSSELICRTETREEAEQALEKFLSR